MLAKGTVVLCYYRAYLDDGQLVNSAGSPSSPVDVVIGDYSLPGNVSYALATMTAGETRIVKAPYRRKGMRPVLATYEVHLERIMKLDAILDEELHGEECACGCHKLRAAFQS